MSISAISKVLVAIDGSPNAIRAAHASVGLAASLQAELIVLSVVTTPGLFVPTRVGHAPPPVSYEDYHDRMVKKASKLVDDMIFVARSQGVKKARGEVIRSTGSVVETIMQAAEAESVDLIVVGTRGLGKLQEVTHWKCFERSSRAHTLFRSRG
jgi:nucleotide-binding universal stress UspA family protein